jgi:hypothetical protein
MSTTLPAIDLSFVNCPKAGIRVTNGLIEGVNRSAERLLGCSQSELQGRSVNCLLPGLTLEEGAICAVNVLFKTKSVSTKVQVSDAGESSVYVWINKRGFVQGESQEPFVSPRENARRKLLLIEHGVGSKLEKLGEVLRATRTRSPSSESPKWFDVHMAFSDAERNFHTWLSLEKMQAGMMESKAEGVALNELVRTIAAWQEDLDLNGSAFEIFLDPSLEHESVVLDQEKVLMVLHRLLINAFRFTPVGKVALRIERKGGSLCFTVQDTGCGMHQDLLDAMLKEETLTERYGSRRFSGAGMDLSCCKRLIEFAGGKFYGESSEGKGASFSCLFPLVLSRADGMESKRDDESVDPSEGGGSGFAGSMPVVGEDEEHGIAAVAKRKWEPGAEEEKRPKSLPVLIVDDDKVQHSILRRKLAKDGFTHVDEAYNGAEALEMMKRTQYGLVLTDIQMPVMDGRQWNTASLKEKKGPVLIRSFQPTREMQMKEKQSS